MYIYECLKKEIKESNKADICRLTLRAKIGRKETLLYASNPPFDIKLVRETVLRLIK